MHQGGGVEGLSRSKSTQLVVRDPSEIVIDEWDQLLEGIRVAIAMGDEKLRDVSLIQ